MARGSIGGSNEWSFSHLQLPDSTVVGGPLLTATVLLTGRRKRRVVSDVCLSGWAVRLPQLVIKINATEGPRVRERHAGSKSMDHPNADTQEDVLINVASADTHTRHQITNHVPCVIQMTAEPTEHLYYVCVLGTTGRVRVSTSFSRRQ